MDRENDRKYGLYFSKKFKEFTQKIMHRALEKFGFSIITDPQRQAFVDVQAPDSGAHRVCELAKMRNFCHFVIDIIFGEEVIRALRRFASWHSRVDLIFLAIFAEIVCVRRIVEVAF